MLRAWKDCGTICAARELNSNMRYFEIVNELFAKPTHIQWEPNPYNDAYSASYKANLPNGAIIQIKFSPRSTLAADGSTWKFNFQVNGMIRNYDSGNAATTVFAAVSECLRTFINERKPTGLMFSAEGSSRQKLYRVLAQRLAAELGWDFRATSENPQTKYFVFDRYQHPHNPSVRTAAASF